MQILTLYEREKIEYSLRIKRGIRDIARVLDRDPGVICREIKRNRNRSSQYHANEAQARADQRARKTNKRKLETDERLQRWVEAKLKAGLSPELIAGRLKNHPPLELDGAQVSHEQIYEYIYDGAGRYEGWYHYLTRQRPRRHRRYGRKKQAKTLIKERVFLTERPAVIAERGRFGDWESDQAQFTGQRERLSVQYERKAMVIRLHKVANKTAKENEQSIAKTLEAVPAHLARSVTFDNGSENVCHTRIRDAFNVQTFFCKPYAAWQKGGVENAIGLIRRYLPKTADLATLNDDDLYAIQEKLNNRPRKKLNYLTPNEAFSVALNS